MQNVNYRVLILAAGLLAASCRTLESNSSKQQNAKTAAQEEGLYETVNGKPQLSVDDNNFYFYWGLWRRLSYAELQQIAKLPGQKASLVSRRLVKWTLTDCATNSLIHENQEQFYFLDELQIENSELKPIIEAVRPGWRYFSMGSFNSQLAEEDKGQPHLTQNPGESARQFRDRKKEALIEWQAKQSRRGQKGEVILEAEHKFFATDPATIKESFVLFQNYRLNDMIALNGQFASFNPSRWPIYYDERAHKPHSITVPRIWDTNEETSPKRVFQAKLVWNWCKDESKPSAQFEIDTTNLPPPGPNRPGRSESGDTDLPITSPQN